MTDPGRRAFLRSVVRGAVGCGLLPPFSRAGGVYLPQGMAQQNAPADALPRVCAALGTNSDPAAEIVRTAIAGLGGMARFVSPGQTVAIKVNATWAFSPGTASCTDPEVLKAVVALVRQAGAARIIVIDHCSIEPGTAQCLAANQLGVTADALGVEKSFPDRYLGDPALYTEIDIPQGKRFQRMGVMKQAVEADVRINLALAKAHSVTRLTMCLKHSMGFLQTPQALHAYLSQGIADINTENPMRSQLYILEAIRVRLPYGEYRACAGPQTDITHPHLIQRKNEIIAGVDPVLIDSYGCVTYFAMKPKELAHVKLAYEAGVGEMDVEAAKASGSLKVLRVGDEALVKPTAVGTATQAPVVEPVEDGQTRPAATVMDLETAAAPGVKEAAGLVTAECAAPQSGVISPNAFLNAALVPVAAIVTAGGLVALRRMPRKGDGGEELNHEPHERHEE